MSLFGKLVRTTINIAVLPIEVVKDVVTLGHFGEKSYTVEQLEKIKEEAEDE